MTCFPLKSTTPAFLLALAAAIAGLPQAAAAQERTTYAIAPVAVTGEPAPGTGGLNFTWVAHRRNLDDSGIVAFNGGLDFNSTDSAVWIGTPGNLTLAVRHGDPAPDSIAQTFYQFGQILVNANGGLSVRATLREDDALSLGGTTGGIWTGPPGNLGLLAAFGEVAPGTAGLTYEGFGLLGSFDDLGVSTFAARLIMPDGSTEPGLWTGTPGAVELLALSGDPAPDTIDLRFSQFADPVSNNTGTRGFLASTTDSSLNYGDGVWVTGPSGSSLLARTGDPAPGTADRSFISFAHGQLFGTTGPGMDLEADDTAGPVLNRTGDVAFNAYLAPYDPETGIADEGVWIRDTNGLRLVIMVGDPAPGAPDSTFIDFNHINLNALGQVAFDAALDVTDPASNHGIWMGPPDSLNLLAREGDPAPDTPGETFANLVMGPSLNGLGDVAFYARLNESNTKGIWAGKAGDLALIAREGEALKVKNADYRTISIIIPFEGAPGSHASIRQFNEVGQVLFKAGFTDGSSGLFLASPIDPTTDLPPVANAGPDQNTKERTAVTLDGAGSTDPEGTVLSFVWSLNGIEIATSPQTTVGPLAPGIHTITLTVTDRGGASASDDMILTVIADQPPVADAGLDRTVNHIQTVYLDGSGSSDPEGGSLTFAWTLDNALISTRPRTTVGPFAVGEYIITLTVTDNQGLTASDSMVITVVNEAPVASAGPDQTRITIESVALDGSGSSDPEGEALVYVWSIGGAQIATGPTPIVGPFDAGTYTVTLTVTDGHGAGASDDMVLTVLNQAPLANAGPDQTVALKGRTVTVTLDGSASRDPDRGVLSYLWTRDGQTVGTGVRIQVELTTGVYTYTLLVTDDHGATDSDTVVVTVVKGNV